MKRKVLVVDDERDIVELVRYNLAKEGFDVDVAYNGKGALEKAEALPDLIVLDLMMPVLDGFETCRRLKANPLTTGIPVVFLTASSSESDEVVGLELGANDYIQKPISPRKLVARVKAALRRSGQQEEGSSDKSVVRIGRLEINRLNYTVSIAEKELFFPRKEFEILALLAAHKGKVFTREALLNRIWGSEVVVIDRTVDVHIRKIREKLGEDGPQIETIKGVGYRLRDDRS